MATNTSTCCTHTNTNTSTKRNSLSLSLSRSRSLHLAVWCKCVEWVRVYMCVWLWVCVFTHTPTSAKYSVAINSLCYRWLRCGAVMFLLLSIKCKPKWQLELSTRHSTALYLQKVNSRVATATAVVVVVAGACVTMHFRARDSSCAASGSANWSYLSLIMDWPQKDARVVRRGEQMTQVRHKHKHM